MNSKWVIAAVLLLILLGFGISLLVVKSAVDRDFGRVHSADVASIVVYDGASKTACVVDRLVIDRVVKELNGISRVRRRLPLGTRVGKNCCLQNSRGRVILECGFSGRLGQLWVPGKGTLTVEVETGGVPTLERLGQYGKYSSELRALGLLRKKVAWDEGDSRRAALIIELLNNSRPDRRYSSATMPEDLAGFVLTPPPVTLAELQKFR